MAAFIAKQLVGKKLDAVKGAVGGGGDDKKDEEETKKDEEAEEALAEQRREEEEKRREKHRQMEEEREAVRQGIRDKYGIKKKETFGGMEDPARTGQIGRKRKTPEELAAEARGETIDGGENEASEGFSLGGLTSKITEGPGQLVNQAQDKCSLM